MENSLKILLLEDSTLDAEIVRRMLAKEMPDCELKMTADKNSYMEALGSYAPDVILCDNSLPRFDATEALYITRSILPHIPFIMVTGTVSEEFAVNIIKSGADDYILKDRLARLPAAIEHAVRQRIAEKEKLAALDRLKANEEKYRMLVERVSDGFIALDLDWHFIYVNKQAEELFKRSAKDLLGKNIWDEFPEAVGKLFYQSYFRAMETQENIHLKDYSFAMDRWVESNIYPSPTGISVYFRDVTEQRKAEQQVKESEERYRTLVERISDAFIALDKDFCYTYMNAQAGKLIHRDPVSIIGKNVWEEFPDAVGSATYRSFHQAMAEQRYIYSMDYYMPLDLWQENHIYPSPDGLSVFIRDVTEKKRAEKAVQRSEEIRKIIINSALDGIICADLSGMITVWNPQAEKMFGWSDSEIFGKSLIETIIPVKYRDAHTEGFDRYLKTGDGPILNRLVEITALHKTGREFPIELAVVPIRKDGYEFFCAFVRDITDRKNAEQQKEFDSKNLAALINNTADLMWSVDKDLKLITFNDSFKNIIQLTTGSPIEKGDNILSTQFTEDQRYRYKLNYERALSGETFTIIDYFEYPAEFWSEISFYPIRKNEEVIGTACFSRDITERKRTERTMQAMEQELLNQKVQEQKKITRAILNAQEKERNHLGQELHDNISQILASTKMFLTTAGYASEATRDAVKYPLELIESSIQEIRSLSSTQVTPLKNVDLKDLIQGLLEKLVESTSIKTSFIYEVKSSAINDDLKLNIYRIIQEQINNIVKYSSAKNMSVSVRAVKKVLRISVEDDGKGFDVNKKRKGIGISNMLNRIESFNGDMHVESSPGHGCKIQFVLPF